MFCQFCGKEVRGEAAFCEYCGQPVTRGESADESAAAASVAADNAVMPESAAATESAAEVAAESSAATATATVPEPVDVRAFLVKHGRWFLLAACALVVLLVVAGVATSLSRRVDLSRFVRMEAVGYNGYSELTVDLDYTALVERVKGDRRVKGYGESRQTGTVTAWNTENLAALNQYAVSEAERALIVNAVRVTTTLPDGVDTTHLSNGDVVAVTLTFDETVADRFGVRVRQSTREYTVAELADTAMWNVWDCFDVQFSGVEGSGHASVVSRAAEVTVGEATFTVEEGSPYVTCRFANGDRSSMAVYLNQTNSGALQVGDTVQLALHVDEPLLAAHGVVLESLTKEVRVEKLGRYITQWSDVQAQWPALFDKAAADVEAYVHAHWAASVRETTLAEYAESDVALGEIAAHQAFLATPRDGLDKNHRYLWLVCAVTLQAPAEGAEDVLYFGVCYRNLTLDAQERLPAEYTYAMRTKGYSTAEALVEAEIALPHWNVETDA